MKKRNRIKLIIEIDKGVYDAIKNNEGTPLDKVMAIGSIINGTIFETNNEEINNGSDVL